MIEVVLLGRGSRLPAPDRAGPATLVRAGGATFLGDAGCGVLMRTAAVGVGADRLSAVFVRQLRLAEGQGMINR